MVLVVEQELQGESFPDGAPPPSKPGATRRQRQNKPKKLRRVWWQVKKLQRATAELYTPKAPFVMEITESCSSQVKRWTPEALLWLQDVLVADPGFLSTLLARNKERNMLEDLLRKLKRRA